MNTPASTASALPAVLDGIWRFTLVSLAGFAPWIFCGSWFYRTLGEVGLYAACLLAFLLTSLVLLPGLLSGPRRRQRCATFFLPAFSAYAVVWCTCWFALGGRSGEWTGALAGGAAFTLITAWLLGRPRSLLLALIVVVATQVLGYFAGDAAMKALAASGRPGMSGMLAWGICYGVGFGAGLGWLVQACEPDQSQGDVG